VVAVKICGITCLEDALLAAELGADALGFVFAPSPRRISPEAARGIVAELPPFVVKVGVFVNSSLADIGEIMSFCNLDLAQLHGEESPEICQALFPRVIKSFTPQTLPNPEELRLYRVAAFLLDGEKSGNTPPEHLWQLARELKPFGRVILAGGLKPENVSQAISMVSPYGVDVASGVERAPGKKDRIKLKDFLKAAKSGLF